jgi:hypothetical protein
MTITNWLLHIFVMALGFGIDSGLVTKEIKILPNSLGPLVHCDRLIAILDASRRRRGIRPDLSKGQRFRFNRVRALTLLNGNLSIHINRLYKQIEVNTSARMLEKGCKQARKQLNSRRKAVLGKLSHKKKAFVCLNGKRIDRITF